MCDWKICPECQRGDFLSCTDPSGKTGPWFVCRQRVSICLLPMPSNLMYKINMKVKVSLIYADEAKTSDTRVVASRRKKSTPNVDIMFTDFSYDFAAEISN